MTEDSGLVREFKLLEAITLGIGGMIGGGIFAAIGQVVLLADGLVFFSLFFCTIVALLTGYSYAKLAEKYPSSGASYTYVKNGFGSKIGSAVAWLLWFGYASASAFYAVSFGLYVSYFININWRILGISLIALLTLINLGGTKFVGKSENTIVFGKVGILLFFIIIGLFHLNFDKIAVMSDPSALNEFSAITSAVLGSAIIFIAYEGFELIATSAEELHNPERNVKIAIFVSIIIVSIIYLLSIVVSLSVVTESNFSSSEAPLVIAAQKFLGSGGAILLGIGAVLATGSALNASLYGSSRILFSLARDGGAPKKLSIISSRTNIPQYSIIFTALMATILATLGVIKEVSALSSMFFLIIFFMVNLTTIKLILDKKITANLVISLLATILITIPIAFILTYLMTALLWVMLVVSIIIAFGVSTLLLKRNGIIDLKENQPVPN